MSNVSNKIMRKRAPFWQPNMETLKCMMYHIDSHRCANELLNFAESCQKFKCSVLFDEDKEEEKDYITNILAGR